MLDARAADADRIERELDMFAAQYQQQVGTLHEQLDRLELDIAEAELGELSKQVAVYDRAAAGFAPPPSMAPSVARHRPKRASPPAPTPCASCFATSPGRSIPTSPATNTPAPGATR